MGAVVVLLLLVFLIFLAYLLLPIGGRVVLLGSDTRESGGTGVAEDSTGSRSDTILVAKSGKGALSVPRDTLVEIPGYGYGEDKINAAFAYGGPELMVETLNDLTDLSINNYVVLDFNGVKDIVDA
ncbi:MAG: LCP family protein, partial [Rubrobacteraceae bacterium]